MYNNKTCNFTDLNGNIYIDIILYMYSHKDISSGKSGFQNPFKKKSLHCI